MCAVESQAGQGSDNGARPDVRRLLEVTIGTPFTDGNALTVLRNGDEIFPAMLGEIRAARRTVDLMTFVYWRGEVAEEFAGAMCDRAEAGVRTRLLLDALGGRLIEKSLLDAMSDAGVDVQWFRRPWLASPYKQNHRCHRKVLVCDGRVGFTGGVGIAEEWSGDARDDTEWRDTHVRIEGPAVDGLAAAFLQDWAETGQPLYDERDVRPPQPTPGDVPLQVVRGSASLGWDDMRMVLTVLTRSARTRLRMATAYFTPNRETLDELLATAARGVQVQLLLPGPHTDKRVSQLSSEANYAELVDGGVQLWNFQPSMMHQKVITVDGEVALIGSPNVNRRSMDHDEEVAVCALDRGVVAVLDQHIDDDMTRSREIDLSRWRNRSVAQRAAEALVTPVRRWL
jgi:cardiolipin synthase